MPAIHQVFSDQAVRLNNRLFEELQHHLNAGQVRNSHWFNGRHENVYLESDSHPVLDSLLTIARTHAADILGRSPESLKAGCWFNMMGAGHTTTLHTHDDDDELLSGVYYLKIPGGDAGCLQIEEQSGLVDITASEGLFVFFPPDLPHRVGENRTGQLRVSIGMNFGPA